MDEQVIETDIATRHAQFTASRRLNSSLSPCGPPGSPYSYCLPSSPALRPPLSGGNLSMEETSIQVQFCPRWNFISSVPPCILPAAYHQTVAARACWSQFLWAVCSCHLPSWWPSRTMSPLRRSSLAPPHSRPGMLSW